MLLEREQRGEGEPTAGGVAGERDPLRLEPLFQQPAVRGSRVVDRGRERMLGREAIVEREHARLCGPREALAHVAVGVNRAEDVAAAVEIEDRAVRSCAGCADPLAFDTAGVDLLGRGSDGELRIGEEVVPTLAHLGESRLRTPGAERGDDIGDHLVELSAGHWRLLSSLVNPTSRLVKDGLAA